MDCKAAGKEVTLDAPLGDTPLHVLAGSIIPMQQPGHLTTADSRASPLTLLVALTQASFVKPIIPNKALQNLLMMLIFVSRTPADVHC